MKSIISVPNDTLTTPAKTVTNFDNKLAKLIGNMKAALLAARHPRGVGLAAPQIGQPWRIFLTRPTEKSAIRVFINPKIIKSSSSLTEGVPERENKLEGCLSVPAIWGRVKRAVSLTLRYQNQTGKEYQEEFSGFLATIIQHETDHVNGILFTQRVLEQKGKLYQATRDEQGKEVLEEISI